MSLNWPEEAGKFEVENTHWLTFSSVSILFLDHPRTSFLRNISRQWFWIFNHAESSQCRNTIIILDTYTGYNSRMSANFAIFCMMPILSDISWFSWYSIICFNIYIYNYIWTSRVPSGCLLKFVVQPLLTKILDPLLWWMKPSYRYKVS